MDSEYTIDSDIGVTPVDVEATKLAEQRQYTVKSGVLFTGLNKHPRRCSGFHGNLKCETRDIRELYPL